MSRTRRSEPRHRRIGLMLGLTLATLAATAGCSRFQPPPIEISFRDSLVGAGKIVRVENTSNQALTGIEATISAPSGESRSYRHERLDGYQTFEIGWKKLGGWQVPLGADVRVRAEGYFLSVKSRLPEQEAQP